MSRRIGLIVGSGFAASALTYRETAMIESRFGFPTSPVLHTELGGKPVPCIARHGLDHRYAPHEVNYQANVWAMKDSGVDACIGLNIVGGIAPALKPGELAVPEQLVDYTWGRQTSFGRALGTLLHVDVTEPFDPVLRGELAAAIEACGHRVHGGVYGVTQGPRLETAAEIDRLARDGCDMVGMTAMPEAALARELGIDYAILAASVNYAAGRAPDATPIHTELEQTISTAMARIMQVLEVFFSRYE
jgi:5'-methylthioinosine phosphorylase